ncbi:chaperone DnaJ-domain superfamily protein [Actinidia rufa]|uniref:Chaperone DnaJ-domain superfamily protein n=1 Tax=Actinidia rufa TaxID=165716 RepID=A0A7J0DWQ8_9ERIC|nr:chaperone DnaJ-domain superfamily protein [Actinidia rufa]
MNSSPEDRKMRDDDADNRSRDNPWPSPNRPREQKAEDMKLWGILIFGLIGATATTFAVGQLRRTVDWFYTQERIRRMQSVFNRERSKFKRSYENWRESGPGAYHQDFQREDWYWKTDASYRNQRTNFRETPHGSASYLLSHHYSVLGLDRLRTKPYTDDEIKTAFRAKAKQFHPDQNQNNKGGPWASLNYYLAEAKFKEVMTSYEAIKMERKNK